MMKKPVHILMIENMPPDVALAQREIRKKIGLCEFQAVETRKDFLKALETFQPDIILADYSLPGFNARKALKLALKKAPLTPFIIWTHSLGEDIAVECLKAGANDYVLKENSRRLGPAVIRALEDRKFLLRRQQGEEKYQHILEHSAYGIFNKPGNPAGNQSTGPDGTGHTQAEERLNDLLAFNEKVLRHSSVGILTYKLTGECVFANENAAAILGTQVEQLKGLNFHTIEAWKRSGLYDLVQRAINTQEPVTADIHHHSTFGRDLWMTVHCVTFPSKDGEHLLLSLTDITERKQAEESLRESENRLILALSGAQISVWEWNVQTNRIFWSPQFLEITGVEENNLETFESFTDLIHPDDVARVMAAAEQAMNSQTLFAEEFRIVRPDGEIRWLSNLGHADYDPTGSHLRLIGTVQDITQRKQAEIERQVLLEIMQGLAHTKDLQELLQLIHHLIARVIFAENFLVALYQPETGLFEEIYSVDQYDSPAPPAKLERSITSYVFRSGEPLLLTQAGFEELVAQEKVALVGTNSASWLGVPLRTSDRTIGVIAVQDYENSNRYSEHDKDFLASIAAQIALAIERKQAEEALRESEEHYRAIFEGVQDAIFVESVDGRILMVNERACEMFGYSQEEFLTKTVSDLVPTGGEPLAVEGTDSTVSIEPRETLNRRANGEVFPIEISGRLQIIHGQSMLLVVVRDITERKRADEALKKAEIKYRTLVEQLPVVTYTAELGVNGAWTYVSPQIENLLGFSAEEWMADPGLWYRQIHPEDRKHQQELEEQAYQRNEPVVGEYRIRARDGRQLWVQDSAQVLPPGEHGAPLVQGVLVDLTGRKQAEEEIRRQTKTRIALYETTQDLVIERDLSKLLQTIVERATQLLNAEGGGLYLCEPERDQVRCVVSLNTQHDFTGTTLRYGEGAAGTVAQTGEPLIVDDYSTWQGQAQIYKDQDFFQSVLSVPIKWQSRVIGVLHALAYDHEHRFNEDDLSLLTSFANQAAIAIQNARLHSGLEQQNRVNLALQEATLPLIKQLDIAEVLQTIIVQAAQLLNTQHGYIYLVKPDESEIELTTGLGELSQFIGSRLKPGEGVAGLVWQTRKPLIVPDYHTWPERSTRFDEVPFRAVISVPLTSATRITGVLGVASIESEHTYNGEDLELLNHFAQLASIALENARLYTLSRQELVERQRAEAAEREQRALAESLRATAEMLSSTLDYGEVLDHILAAAGQVVPHDAGTILLIEEGSAQVVRSEGYEKYEGNIKGVSLDLAETSNLRKMVETRQPEIVYDTYSYAGWQRMESTDWLRSSVGAPISIYGNVIGFICLDARPPQFFTPVHAERLQTFANQAAIAIHNARLLQQAQAEITERIQVEQELRASEERFLQLANNIQEVFWMTDAETGQEIYMSPAAELIWGRPIENLIHEPGAFINSIYPEDRARVLEAIDREKKGEKVEIEYRIVQPGGTLRWVWDRAFPIFDASGGVTRIAGISADITERRASEIALIKSQSRYRELFDNSPISIWEEDYSLVKKRLDTLQENGVMDLKEYFSRHPEQMAELASLVRVTDANKAALELYHIEQKEILLKGLNQILSADALSHFHEEILGFAGPSKRFVWEGTDRMFNGAQIEVLVTGSIPQGYTEDWSKVIVSVHDITERKRAEKEIQRRAKETSALLETSLALTNLDLQITLQTIGNSAKALFSGDGCRIFLMGPEGEFLRCVMALQENFAAFSDMKIRLGEGVTGAVAASGQAEIVNEMQKDPRALQVPGTPEREAEAVMFAPLKERDHTIGVLSIRRAGAERPFRSDDLELLEAFASMAASAVSNARLFEETQRRLDELQALYENGLAVGRLLEPREIGNRLIETFARYLRWHHVTIRLRREGTDDLELVAFNLPGLESGDLASAAQHFIARINKVGQGLSGWVIQTGIPVRTGNVQAYPQYVDIHAGVQSGLYMPLKIGERVIGVVSVESELQDAFTGQDERLLATLASQAAIAFENAHLYEAMQKELNERKRAEEALRGSETHYRELADSITDILFELDQNLDCIHWNKASETLIGIPASDAIGRSISELFGETEEQSRIQLIYEDVLRSHQRRTFETVLALNGQRRPFEINAYPSTRGVSVVAKDVTDRKRSEIIMEKRFELMEYSAQHSLDDLMQRTVDEVSALTGSTVGFFHFIQEDQNTLGMQTWSTNTLRVFDVPVSEGTHRALEQAGVWADAVRQRRPLIQNDYESLPTKGRLPQGHVPIRREIVIPIIRNERIVAVMGIGNKPQDYTPNDLEIAEHLADYAWDITERKQMEVALETERNQLAQRVEERTSDLSRANANLARALRVKDEFLANMSHELRTPLNAILGLSESLGEQIAGPLNEKQQKYITTISESGHHLLALINDILDLAKIDAGQITLDINKVDIHSVCQSSLRMIKQLAQKKNQEVILQIEEGLGLMWADERRLKQMIVNLLGNAVKFTQENGKIGLEVHADRAANSVTITVWDNGIGIKPEDLARLFQPFVQLDSGLARESTGTGLGLALVAQMARLHGGSVTAFSDPGEGSRFSIILPWEPAIAMDTATRLRITGKFRAIKPDETNKPIILLVEDTQEVVMMIRDYLELAGYKVVTAQDGVDAIAQAKLTHPNLILMDVQMPRMDGLEATRRLRSEAEFKYTPIIALTALAMPHDRERCLTAGMDEYISKPVNLKALVKIIQSCLFNAEGTLAQ